MEGKSPLRCISGIRNSSPGSPTFIISQDISRPILYSEIPELSPLCVGRLVRSFYENPSLLRLVCVIPNPNSWSQTITLLLEKLEPHQVCFPNVDHAPVEVWHDDGHPVQSGQLYPSARSFHLAGSTKARVIAAAAVKVLPAATARSLRITFESTDFIWALLPSITGLPLTHLDLTQVVTHGSAIPRASSPIPHLLTSLAPTLVSLKLRAAASFIPSALLQLCPKLEHLTLEADGPLQRVLSSGRHACLKSIVFVLPPRALFPTSTAHAYATVGRWFEVPKLSDPLAFPRLKGIRLDGESIDLNFERNSSSPVALASCIAQLHASIQRGVEVVRGNQVALSLADEGVSRQLGGCSESVHSLAIGNARSVDNFGG